MTEAKDTTNNKVDAAGAAEYEDGFQGANGSTQGEGVQGEGVQDDVAQVDGAQEGTQVDGESSDKTQVDGDFTSETQTDGESSQAQLAQALEKAKEEIEEWRNKYMRLHAEWDTYRRRTNKQRVNEKKLATESLVNNIIPVLDDFARTIEYARDKGEKGLLDGVIAVCGKLEGVLEKCGLQQIDPKGEPFDAIQHAAMATVPDKEAYDETVCDVYQKGYKMGNKVLRPAMVTVTTGGPQRPQPEEDSEKAEAQESNE